MVVEDTGQDEARIAKRRRRRRNEEICIVPDKTDKINTKSIIIQSSERRAPLGSNGKFKIEIDSSARRVYQVCS